MSSFATRIMASPVRAEHWFVAPIQASEPCPPLRKMSGLKGFLAAGLTDTVGR